MPFIPHTKQDIDDMLNYLGEQDVMNLFSEVPAGLKTNLSNKVSAGMNELEVTKLMQSRAAQDDGVYNYIGGGAYEHHIPALVWDIVSRGEFMTAYTPYQAEASQGGLQIIYEYQTMICNLTAKEASNASLYDGATALAEAILMSVRCNKKSNSRTILVLGTMHPSYIDTVKTIISHQNIEIILTDINDKSGVVSLKELSKFENLDLAAVVVSQPNFFGQLEDVDMLTDWAHNKNSLVIAAVNPISLALLEAPGNWGKDNIGADIVCGEGQPLGVPLSSGGPYFGFMACNLDIVRQMPGRIVGRTTDTDGKPGFTLTLQAREQHIRRSKATSNICTNQGLLVTAATIYMTLLGAKGLEQVAKQCCANTEYLVNQLCKIDGINRRFEHNNFHEAVIKFDDSIDLSNLIYQLNKLKISPGLNLSEYNNHDLSNCLLLCVTETKDKSDLDYYINNINKIINNK